MAYIGQTPTAVPLDGDDIADDIVDSQHYAAGSIDTAHLADDQITLAKMAAGTDGNIISYDASGNPVAIATGTDGQVLTSTGAGSPPAFEAIPASGLQTYLVNLSYDQSTTGDIAVTGFGFAPTAGVVNVFVHGLNKGASWSFAKDGGTDLNMYDYNTVVAGAHNAQSVRVATLYSSVGNFSTLVISAWGSDGVTFTKTKTGSPTGTAYCFALFMR